MLSIKASCKDCERSYIGETGRNLQIRLTEHKAAVRKGDRKNGIAINVQDHDHCLDWEAARVVDQEPHYILEKKSLGGPAHSKTYCCVLVPAQI